jgi:hypothetical protein
MKNTLKLKTLMAVGVAAITISFSAQAHAFLLLGGEDFNAIRTGPEAIVCFVLFPFCVLGDENSSQTLTPKDLSDSGYTDDQIAEIQKGQATLFSKLTEMFPNNKSVEKTQIAKAVAELKNENKLSDLYLTFVNQ